MYKELDTIQVTFLIASGDKKTEVLQSTSIIAACQRVINKWSTGIGTVKILQACIIN
jgi:soluble P-type ATPase